MTLFDGDTPIKTVKLVGVVPVVRFANGEIITAATGGKVTFLNQELEVVRAMSEHETKFRDIRLTANKNYIVWGDRTGRVYFRKRDAPHTLELSELLKSFMIYNHKEGITSVDVQNEIVASGSFDKTVQVWNMASMTKLFDGAHGTTVWCVKVIDEKVLSCGDKIVRVWSLAGRELYEFRHSNWCNNFDLNMDKTLLAVAHSDGLSIWNFSSRIKLKEIEINDVWDVRFNESGTKLVFGLYDGTIYHTSVV